MRFISIIEDSGRIWTDYAVVDTVRFIRMARCSDIRDAETIAAVLNIHYREREAKLISEGVSHTD